MTVDLRDQLQELCAVIEEEQGPVSADDVRARVTPVVPLDRQMRPPAASRRAWPAAVAGAVLILILVGGVAWLSQRGGDLDPAEEPTETTIPETTIPVTTVPQTLDTGDGQTVSVTVSGVSGHTGHDLAGVLYEGGELTDLDRDVVGGFWSVISGDDFTTTEVVREPGELGVGLFPFVSAEALTAEPGTYTLVVWVDTALNPVDRRVPINTDGQGLLGCQVVFEVGDDAQTDVFVSAGLQPDGWNINCTTGLAIPGTDSTDAVTPSMPSSAMSMPPVSGVGDGQTVSVTVSGVSGHAGHDLAGVLYEGGELTDLDRDAVGGFWSVISGDEFTTTEVVREPEALGVGRFPFVSTEALTVEPGTYTLVVWEDHALNPESRWVPINTDGQGLFGCQVVFEVGDDARTDVVVSGDLQPDGWNINCTTP